MKSNLFLTVLSCIIVLVMFNKNISAQTFSDSGTTEDISTDTTSGFAIGTVLGATTIDGENYQQIAFRADIPIGKLGIGLDIQLNLDEDGQIRKEDWDEFGDYLDKFYYIRWARKGDPLYVKVGGLDYSYLGYQNVINGYSNMIEYPTVKRWGMETSFYFGKDADGNSKKKLGAEFFINNFKETFRDNPSMLFGTRVFYRPVGKLEIGATYASDLNEYNGLGDSDDDGIPDEIDQYPYDSDWATERDKKETALSELGLSDDAIEQHIANEIAIGDLDSLSHDDLFNLNDNTSTSKVWSVDIGYPVIERTRVKLDIYSQFTRIVNYGWGITAPGLRFLIGQKGFFTFRAEYRKASKEFMYGYYDYTYEMQRANFVTDTAGNLVIKTKQEMLKDITDDLNGIFVGLDIKLGGYILMTAEYQDLRGDDISRKSVRGEVGIGDKLKEIIPVDVKGYYYQSNVEDFTTWKTPSTILGYTLAYKIKGTVSMGFDFRYTFKDLDGSGEINGSDEMIKTIGLKSSVTF